MADHDQLQTHFLHRIAPAVEGFDSLASAAVELFVWYNVTFFVIVLLLRPDFPRDPTRVYVLAAAALAIVILIAAYCNYARLRRLGRTSRGEALVGLFRPRLFLALFGVALMLFQVPVFATFFLRLCLRHLGLVAAHDWIEQHAWLLSQVFVLVGVLSVPAIYLYRRTRFATAPTLAETAWSAVNFLIVPTGIAFVGFIVTIVITLSWDGGL
jgi:hypothetical protein